MSHYRGPITYRYEGSATYRMRLLTKHFPIKIYMFDQKIESRLSTAAKSDICLGISFWVILLFRFFLILTLF